MKITKIIIENFKCFKSKFEIDFNQCLNIIVGDNEAGKSTILEAIHLGLSGILNGKYLRNQLTQYLFNYEIEQEYISSLKTSDPMEPPSILIEIHFTGENLSIFEGDDNYNRQKGCGIYLKIEFDSEWQNSYEELVKTGEVKTIPIEYYKIVWKSFARDNILSRNIPIKSILIDSASKKYQNGSDIYISRIIQNDLEEAEKVAISQAHRKLKEIFMQDSSIEAINKKINAKTDISDKDIKISVDLSNKNAWESTLITYMDNIPFHQIGKGEQCIVKTHLSLSHNKAKESNLILFEEPENHLSHSILNKFIKSMVDRCEDKQIIVSTHSSFVANKLGLDNLILLNNKNVLRLDELDAETKEFFRKLPGYSTLRLLLSKKTILVEGDCDELVIQKAYRKTHNEKLPIQDRIDIISVGTSFKRFLEIAEKLIIPVAVVTDNDGDVNAVKRKYSNYIDGNKKENIEIFFDDTIDNGSLTIGSNNIPFNYNTLEPKIVKENDLATMNTILEKSYEDIDGLHKYMKLNKTDCALKIFDTDIDINFPEYINKVIEWCDE